MQYALQQGCQKALYCDHMNTFRQSSFARLRFRHLELVRLLGAVGSLRAAALALHQTQSALSKSLKEAELLLGCTLFERTRRGLKPTPEGRVVARGAEVLFRELEHIREEALAARGSVDAILRIGVVPFLALGLLPGVLDRLLNRASGVHVRVMEGRVPRLYEALLAGDLDAILTTYSSEQASSDGGVRLLHEQLFEAEVWVIAPAGHPAARRPGRTWKDLARERWILPGEPSLIRRLVDDQFLRQGLAPIVPAIESVSPLTNVMLVASGLGLSAVPASALEQVERARAVRRVRLAPPIPTVPVALVTRRTGASNPRVVLLREALRLARNS